MEVHNGEEWTLHHQAHRKQKIRSQFVVACGSPRDLHNRL